MKKKIVRVLRISLGVILITGGIIGLFLPILQGILMITAGILLIAPEKGKRLIERCKAKLKKMK